MEFKSIDTLSITECCEFLTKEMLLDALRHMSETTIQNQAYIEKIEMCLKGMTDSRLCRTNLLSLAKCSEQFKVKMETFFEAFRSSPDLTDHDRLIIRRLETLLKKERSDFEHCSTIEQYEKYLFDWNEGIHRDKAIQQIVELKAEAKELAFYKKNKNTISGLESYIKKYPSGRFIQEAKGSLANKKKARKIRNIILLIIAIVIAIVVCLINYFPVSYLDVSGDVSFGKRGGNKTITISTDANDINIDVQESSDWIDVNRDGGTLSINVVPNTDDEKSAYITVNTYSSFFGKKFNCISKTIKVSQSSGLPTYLKTNTSEISFDKYGNCSSNQITATTDGCDLQVSTSASWFSVSKNITEDGDNIVASIVLTTSTNNEGSKTGEVVISSANMTKRVKVFQESGLANCFELATSNLSIPEAGSDYNIKVNTDGTFWSVSSSPDWLTAYADLEDKRLKIKVPANTGKIQSGTITIKSNNGDLRDINVTQEGDPTIFRPAKDIVKFGTSSGYEYVTIYNNSHKNLEINEYEEWLSATAIGNDKIKISCTSNSNERQSGTVYVHCGDEQFSITVKQDGWTYCWTCRGRGKIQCQAFGFWPNGYHYVQDYRGYYFPCPDCGGSGTVDCFNCGGRGRIESTY